MNIKIATFQSRLQHSPEFNREISEFIRAIETALSDKLVFTDLEDYDCDLKLIFVQTGGSEGYFLQNFNKLQEPYYILTNGANNSLAASLEILTYLNLKNKKGEILHGDAEYIAKRIKTLAQTNKIIKQLKSARLGVIGAPSDWLISSVPDYRIVKQKLGITLVDVPLDDVEKFVAAPRSAKTSPSDYKDFNAEDMDRSIAIYDAIAQIAESNHFDGVTIRCFDLLSSLKGTGCLALAELNRRGIIGTCEGDVAAMISMYVANLISGQSGFQANPSRLNTKNNRVVFAHCTVPFDMLTDYRFDTHFESGIGVAIKGELKTDTVTVFRISSDLKRYFVSSGQILANTNDKNLCRTQIDVALDSPVTELLTAPCGNHHVILYGDHVEQIDNLMQTLIG